MAIPLTARERSHLKARAHALEPRVQVGHSGMTDAVAAEVDRALTAHELIKVKILDGDRAVRREIADALCARADAALVQSVGKVFVLWRPTPDGRPPADAVTSGTGS
ncbi:MAG: ribosome assembly RNA-binding protein YhbY [Vicinamibacterales bacterium]